LPTIRAFGEHETFEILAALGFDDVLNVLVDLADRGCFLRLALAPDASDGEEEEFTSVWAREFSVPKSAFPRWLQQELARLKRDAKRGRNRHAYVQAQRLGLYAGKSTLGKVERFRYLRPEDLEVPPQPYPDRETWNPDAWVRYDPEFLAELAEKQHLDPQFRWLGQSLRRAGDRVQWVCACRAAFVSVEEYDRLSAEPRNPKRPYPESVTLLHPSEGRVYVYILPKGRIASIEFEDRGLECAFWNDATGSGG
jgi:hypothetical protein